MSPEAAPATFTAAAIQEMMHAAQGRSDRLEQQRQTFLQKQSAHDEELAKAIAASEADEKARLEQLASRSVVATSSQMRPLEDDADMDFDDDDAHAAGADMEPQLDHGASWGTFERVDILIQAPGDNANSLNDDGSFRIFDVCRSGGAGNICGVCMPAHFWAKPTEQHRWYCKCDWDFAASVDSGLKAKLEKTYGVKSDFNEAVHAKHPYDPCCGARYWPWATGEFQIVDIDLVNKDINQVETFCFIADRLPEGMGDEIKKAQGSFMKAQAHLSDTEILESLPKVYPCDMHSVDRDTMPGIGKFPVDEWAKDGQHLLYQAGWVALARKIAKCDLENLGDIFDLGESLV